MVNDMSKSGPERLGVYGGESYGESSVLHVYAPQNIYANSQPHWKNPLIAEGENHFPAEPHRGVPPHMSLPQDYRTRELGPNPYYEGGSREPSRMRLEGLGGLGPSRDTFNHFYSWESSFLGALNEPRDVKLGWGPNSLYKLDDFCTPCEKISSDDFPFSSTLPYIALSEQLMKMRQNGVSWTLYIESGPDTQPAYMNEANGYARRARKKVELTEAEEREAKRRYKDHWVCVSLSPCYRKAPTNIESAIARMSTWRAARNAPNVFILITA